MLTAHASHWVPVSGRVMLAFGVRLGRRVDSTLRRWTRRPQWRGAFHGLGGLPPSGMVAQRSDAAPHEAAAPEKRSCLGISIQVRTLTGLGSLRE
eukprot:7030024-Prymnesium_polylepis.1